LNERLVVVFVFGMWPVSTTIRNVLVSNYRGNRERNCVDRLPERLDVQIINQVPAAALLVPR
jgi:hypothetical protein